LAAVPDDARIDDLVELDTVPSSAVAELAPSSEDEDGPALLH
jgi:hypothetical protein